MVVYATAFLVSTWCRSNREGRAREIRSGPGREAEPEERGAGRRACVLAATARTWRTDAGALDTQGPNIDSRYMQTPDTQLKPGQQSLVTEQETPPRAQQMHAVSVVFFTQIFGFGQIPI